jgi:hypothetical protein
VQNFLSISSTTANPTSKRTVAEYKGWRVSGKTGCVITVLSLDFAGTLEGEGRRSRLNSLGGTVLYILDVYNFYFFLKGWGL